MADCECLSTCIFFNDKMANMPATSGMYKKNYCCEDNAHCARFMIVKTVGRTKVPSDLFPNQVDRAKSIIAKG